ncbi:PilN domain-containing protein [Pseudomonas sp. Fl4BN1]|uniref:PilN domain-containing protein n=1 Tax=Pseudomonas sp. Fl4BN1 TaxID=2697651 RepID=UPI001378BCB1|nr:PilN domain-containing protein [Pseudomonas sp. Fl4BN1]NBF07367.1 pilus assembly protein PilN [Pseudomonas sp. Fl4BN1]
MARINLLPWREASRELRRRRFLRALAAMIVLGGGVVLLADAYIGRLIERQRLRGQYLGQATLRLDKQIASIHELKAQRQQLLERMSIIEGLQGNRSSNVRVFQQLTRSLPDGVYFTEVDLQGQSLVISGAAESNNRVSDLMRNLQSAEGFAAPSLTKVKSAADTNQGLGNLFRLSVGQTPVLPVEPGG